MEIAGLARRCDVRVEWWEDVAKTPTLHAPVEGIPYYRP